LVIFVTAMGRLSSNLMKGSEKMLEPLEMITAQIPPSAVRHDEREQGRAGLNGPLFDSKVGEDWRTGRFKKGNLVGLGMQRDNCFFSSVRPCPFGATKLHVLLSDFDIKTHLFAVNGQISNLTLVWEPSSTMRKESGRKPSGRLDGGPQVLYVWDCPERTEFRAVSGDERWT
jgi:hypothetical protein